MVKTLLRSFPEFCSCKKCEEADFDPTDPASLPHWMGERETYTKIVYMAVETYHMCQVNIAQYLVGELTLITSAKKVLVFYPSSSALSCNSNGKKVSNETLHWLV